MTASRDPNRLIHAFLTEGADELPTRVYDAVRSDIDRTHQRVVIGPWRTPDMNTLAKLALAAATVVVVAVAGYNLLPGTTGVGPAVSPSPSPSASPSPASTLPPDGPVPLGTYGALLDGVDLTFSVSSAGWRTDHGTWIGQGTLGEPGGFGIGFWGMFDNVYADPCAHTPLSPPAPATAAGLATAVASISGTDLVSGPTTVTLGGRPAHHVVFKIRDDIDCEPHDFYLYYDDETGGPSGGWRWADALDTTYQVWIVDVDGAPFLIDAVTYTTDGRQPTEAIQDVIDSIRFE